MDQCTAPDAYTMRYDDAIARVTRKLKCIDDTLLYDTSVKDSFWYIYEYLETYARKAVTLKSEKKFGRRETDFVVTMQVYHKNLHFL